MGNLTSLSVLRTPRDRLRFLKRTSFSSKMTSKRNKKHTTLPKKSWLPSTPKLMTYKLLVGWESLNSGAIAGGEGAPSPSGHRHRTFLDRDWAEVNQHVLFKYIVAVFYLGREVREYDVLKRRSLN